MRYYLIEVIIQQLYYTFSTIFINYSLQCTFIAMLEVTIVMTPIKAVVKNTRYFTAFYDLKLSLMSLTKWTLISLLSVLLLTTNKM